MTKFDELDRLDTLLTPFSSIGRYGMLITAGGGVAREQWNTMTASWGSFGVYWHKKTVTAVIRHSRYTFEFVEKEPLVTFSFFAPERKNVLAVCGKISGRDADKAKESGITPVLLEPGAVGFADAELNVVCKKIYSDDMPPDNFLDPGINKFYETNDYHRMYICEVLRWYQEKL